MRRSRQIGVRRCPAALSKSSAPPTGNKLHWCGYRQGSQEIRILRVRVPRVSLPHKRRTRELSARHLESTHLQHRNEGERACRAQPSRTRAEYGGTETGRDRAARDARLAVSAASSETDRGAKPSRHLFPG